ncbi:MAG: hypothetical protein ACJ749_18280, partial [Flavisolibacter sp.]
PCCEITLMLIDLHKTFSFNHQKDIYQVDYVFEKDGLESDPLSHSDICLTVTFSKNYGGKITDKTNKASSVLSQSNENIQQFIETKILSYN